jgi:PAS domain S-box-containing protein
MAGGMISQGARARLRQLLQSLLGTGVPPDPRTLARSVVDHLRDSLAVDGAAMAWLDPETGWLSLLATNIACHPQSIGPSPAEQGAIGRAFESRQPVIVRSYASWSPAAAWERGLGVTSSLAVPVLIGERSVGAMAVYSTAPRDFASSDVEFLSLITTQLAVVLEIGRLYGEAERRRIEADAFASALATSEHELRTLYEAISCGILVRDASGRISEVNAAAAEIVGIPAEKLRGHRPEDLWPACREDGSLLRPDERPGVVALMSGQAVRHVVVGISRPTGERRWLQVTAVPVPGPDGKPRKVVSSFIDITARKESERQMENLAQIEKLRALGQMASSVAHDLNQYLALITGHADLALQALDRDERDAGALRESLRVIVQAATDGAETIKNLLTFARPPQELPTSRVMLGELLADVVRLTAPRWRDAAQAEGREVKVDLSVDGDTTIEGSPESLREAFANLILNAVDALPRGGTIRLVARRRADLVEVEVSDNGTGMSEEVRARVFEPFFTTKGERGTGLGLPIVLSVVQQHRGQITLETRLGEGTTFRLAFPAPAAVRPSPPAMPTKASLRILAVDDELPLAKLIGLMLGADGHTVELATSGEEALRILEEQPFDLVISDVGMGSGMNGWQLAEAVRARYPTTRFCLATGWGAQIDPNDAHARGVHAIVAKPYRIADLRRLISDV